MSKNHLTLSIAGIPLAILDEQPTHSWLTERCREFHAQPGVVAKPGWTIMIARNPQFEIGQETILYALGDNPGAFSLHAYDFKAHRQQCGEPIQVEAHPDAAIIGIVRWLMAVLLVEAGGLLVHSASFAYRGSGVLCPGVSGAGKSTLSRLIQSEVDLFSDETAAVRFSGDIPVLYSTPFCGELGIIHGPAAAPLESLFLLRHDSVNAVCPVALIDVVCDLVAGTFMPIREGLWMSRVMETAEKLARQVSAAKLHFRPEPDIWSTLNGVIDEAAAAA